MTSVAQHTTYAGGGPYGVCTSTNAPEYSVLACIDGLAALGSGYGPLCAYVTHRSDRPSARLCPSILSALPTCAKGLRLAYLHASSSLLHCHNPLTSMSMRYI